MGNDMECSEVDSKVLEIKQFQLLTASIELAGNIAGVLRNPDCHIPYGNRELLIQSHNTLLMAINDIAPIDSRELDSLIIQPLKEQAN